MTEVEPFVDRAKKLAMSLQFVRILLMIVFLSDIAIQAIFSVFYSGSWSYYKAFYGTLVSYGIILYKAHGKPQLNKEFLARILQDENSQYFLLSIVWATAPPIKVALFPYATFSLFHSLGYIRSELIPKLFPGETLPQSRIVASQINSIMTKFQPSSIWAVARAEVWIIFPMTIITIVWGGTSLFTPFLYQQFLQFRFLSSPMTRQVFTEVEVTFDKHIANNPQVPDWAKGVYAKSKDIVKTYCNLEARARAAQEKKQ